MARRKRTAEEAPAPEVEETPEAAAPAVADEGEASDEGELHVVPGRGITTLRGIVTKGPIEWSDLSRDEAAGRAALEALRKGKHVQ